VDTAPNVLRNHIAELDDSEPVVQKAANDSIIVELPGIDDPQRAEDVVQKSAFLEFQITDKTQALEKALPRIDAALKDTKVATATPAAAGNKDSTSAGLQSLFTADTSKKADTTKKDTTAVAGTVGGPGPVSQVV